MACTRHICRRPRWPNRLIFRGNGAIKSAYGSGVSREGASSIGNETRTEGDACTPAPLQHGKRNALRGGCMHPRPPPLHLRCEVRNKTKHKSNPPPRRTRSVRSSIAGLNLRPSNISVVAALEVPDARHQLLPSREAGAGGIFPMAGLFRSGKTHKTDS